jgi:hypothetical protein
MIKKPVFGFLVCAFASLAAATLAFSQTLSISVFTVTSIPTDHEIKEDLVLDAQILKLPQPVPASSVFDFTIQREVNKELGLK